MKAFEVLLVEEVPCGADDIPLEIEVAFIQCQQIAATVGGDLFGKPQRFANMLIYRNPARC